MQLSSESRRARWTIMGSVWLVVAVLLFLHAVATRDYLAIVGQAGLRNHESAASPLKMAYPAGEADAQVWVEHALALLEGHDLRLRHTTIDNAPLGREVHWNSAWAWTIAGAGWIGHRVTGDPLERAVERSTIWLPPVVLFALIVLLSSVTARRAGALAGTAVALALVGHRNVYEGFIPSYVDHHGLLTMAVFGLVLGAVLMGAGWWQERTGDAGMLPSSPLAARRAATISALSGALGMWVSAASVIPPIALVGLAGVMAALATGGLAQHHGARFDAAVWRTWGRVGAAASFCLYLAEYFPSHLGLRLEVNHPLYALAWLSAGEVIATVGERLAGPADGRWRDPVRLLAPLAFVVLAPMTIVVGGASVFAPLDPFLAALHRSFILEFRPLWSLMRGVAWNPYTSAAGIENLPLLAGIAALAVRGRKCGPVVWFATLATLGFTAMTLVQSRWLLNGSGPQIVLTLVLLAQFTAGRAPAVRWGWTLGVIGVVFFPSAITRIVDARASVAAHAVVRDDAVSVLYRDVAVALRGSQPAGDITVLASPNASVELGYYGRFRTLGTFYWENGAGLKAAAAILSAASADEAAALIRERKVTHVAMISEGDFLGEYYQLLHPGATEADFEGSFGYRLFFAHEVPPWLQPIPYDAPEDLKALDVNVQLFRVLLDQHPTEELYKAALAEAAAGQLADARRDFDEVIRQDPKSYLAWLGKSSVLFTLRNWVAAADAALTGIALAPAADRPGFYGQIARSFRAEHQPAQAVRLSRAALSDGYNPDVACFLAFVLATSADPRVRNGAEAVALARRAAETDADSPGYQTCLAAALAETGQYAEAGVAAARARASARARGDADAERLSGLMLDAFKAARPWRE
jgi:tetratricopeptide (TPR) repeat protein